MPLLLDQHTPLPPFPEIPLDSDSSILSFPRQQIIHFIWLQFEDKVILSLEGFYPLLRLYFLFQKLSLLYLELCIFSIFLTCAQSIASDGLN